MKSKSLQRIRARLHQSLSLHDAKALFQPLQFLCLESRHFWSLELGFLRFLVSGFGSPMEGSEAWRNLEDRGSAADTGSLSVNNPPSQ